MAKNLRIIVLAFLSAPCAQADLIYEQSVNTQDFGFLSSFTAFLGQQVADQFELVDDVSLTEIVFFGTNFAQDFGAQRDFTIRIFNDAGIVPAATPFFDVSVTADVANTGLEIDNAPGAMIFSFTAPLSVQLFAGVQYWLSVVDEDATQANADSFIWQPGFSAGDASANRFGDGGDWSSNSFGPDRFRDQFAYRFIGDTVSSPIPEPGTLALLCIGLAGIGLASRRKLRFALLIRSLTEGL